MYIGQNIDLCSDELERGRSSMSASYAEITLAGCILILPFLYESSHIFRFYLKFFLYYFLVSCVALVVIPYYCFKAKDVRNLV